MTTPSTTPASPGPTPVERVRAFVEVFATRRALSNGSIYTLVTMQGDDEVTLDLTVADLLAVTEQLMDFEAQKAIRRSVYRRTDLSDADVVASFRGIQRQIQAEDAPASDGLTGGQR